MTGILFSLLTIIEASVRKSKKTFRWQLDPAFSGDFPDMLPGNRFMWQERRCVSSRFPAAFKNTCV